MPLDPAKLPFASSRQLIWQRIRAHGGNFTFKEIVRGGKQEPGTVRSYLLCLIAAGIVACVARRRGSIEARYRLQADCGVERPRVTTRGKPVTAGLVTEQMWQTIRLLNEFTARDLAIMASVEHRKVGLRTARRYCGRLARAGYLATVKPPTRGTGGRATLYRFIRARDHGPRAPHWQKIGALWDPNLGEIVWHEEIDA